MEKKNRILQMLQLVIYCIIFIVNAIAQPGEELSRSYRENRVRNSLRLKFGNGIRRFNWKSILRKPKFWPKQVPIKDPVFLSDEELGLLEKSLDSEESKYSQNFNSIISSVLRDYADDHDINSLGSVIANPETERPMPNVDDSDVSQDLYPFDERISNLRDMSPLEVKDYVYSDLTDDSNESYSDLSYSDDSILWSMEDHLESKEDEYTGDFDTLSIEDSILYRKNKKAQELLKNGYAGNFDDPL